MYLCRSTRKGYMPLYDDWNNCAHPPCGSACHRGHPHSGSSCHCSNTGSKCNQHQCHSGNRCNQQHKNLNNSAANNGKKKSFINNLCYCCCPCCGRRSGASKIYIHFIVPLQKNWNYFSTSATAQQSFIKCIDWTLPCVQLQYQH